MEVNLTTPVQGEAAKLAPKKIDWRAYRSIFALIGVMIVFSILTEGTFLTPRNLTNLTRQVAINGMLAVGMTYVILIGGIDLSIGSVVALSGVVAGLVQVNLGLSQWVGPQMWLGAALSVFAAIIVGLSCGVFNAFLITRYKIAPFIITLGLMVIARGLALIVTDGSAIAPLGDAFNWLGQEYISKTITLGLLIFVAFLFSVSLFKFVKRAGLGLQAFVRAAAIIAALWIAFYSFQGYRGLPIPVLLFAVTGFIGFVILEKTRLGRFVLAMGGNTEAAWLSGVPIRKISFGIYVVMGALAGLSGAVLSARLNGALPTAGELFELDAIAAVVIGGTSLLGGVGTVQGSILGAFFIGSLNNGMSLMDVSEFYQKVIKGVIIILAVWFDTRQSKLKN